MTSFKSGDDMLQILVKGVFVVLGLLVIAAFGMLLKMAADSRRMNVVLGVQNENLRPCPNSPNCVCSDMPLEDSHYIAPIADPDGSRWAMLIEKVNTMEGAELVHSETNYARFTFRTTLMGFMDDVEFHYRPAEGFIAVRSASRVGYSDWNANSKRINAVRSLLE